MANKDSKPHLYIGNNGSRHPLKKKPLGGEDTKPKPKPERYGHVAHLSHQLASLTEYEREVALAAQAEELERVGIQVTFQGFEGFELVFDGLSDERQKVELLNIQVIGSVQYATVFVPEGKLSFFQKKLEKYAETIDESSPARKKLIESIASLSRATLKALWTDDLELLPANPDEEFSWEVWLVKGDGTAERQFKMLAEQLGIELSPHQINFRERVVLYARASASQLSANIHLLNSVAELRKPKETAEFFDNLTIEEQRDWANDLASRIVDSRNDRNPVVTILDTGVNIGHPLISPFSNARSLHTVNQAFGTADNDGHGTHMTGLSLYGDLQASLESNDAVEVAHSIESVKIIHRGGDNRDQAYGAITIDATTAPEIQTPNVTRIFTMAVSATDTRDFGRPTAWSAAIDELCFNRLGEQDPKRLFIVAAGNAALQPADYQTYPSCLDNQLIHDPGQAWNALTVGAYTEKVTLTDAKQGAPVASAGQISPYTSTSVEWSNKNPVKPDVVFEGGNVALGPLGGVTHPSLSLLTTNHEIQERLFTTLWATSAATALAANFSAKIYAAYPNLRPETVRGLIVHSAEWNDALKQQATGTTTVKQLSAKLLRRVGFGVPNIEVALDSASQRVAVIIEDEITPFKKSQSGGVGLNEIVTHDLPWPKEILQDLANTEVKLTVTLSYFIEPNPSSRAFNSKYSYQSHNLAFDLKRALEDADALVHRINTDDQPEDFQSQDETGDWLIGTNNRAHGSISKDVWTGTAADLAERNKIAIIPTAGWWKNRTPLKMYGETTRYSLILTIEAPGAGVDIYSAVKAIVETQVATPVDVQV